MELVIMAGGLGSRFGGLKQLEPIDKNNNFIIDYSIYDAIRCGFNKVIIIINENNFKLFRDTIGKRIENFIEVVYVFQNNENFPKIITPSKERTKPFGTAHAVLCAKGLIHDNFAVINADDFYGYDAFKKVSSFLKNNKNENVYSLISYEVQNTLSENDSVKRGICEIENNNLLKITECKIIKKENEIFAKNIEQNSDQNLTLIKKETAVSMNLFGFTPKIFNYLDSYFLTFLMENKENLETCEFFLPTVVSTLIQDKKVKVNVIPTTSKWLGMTYKEDKPFIVKEIGNMIKNGIYPTNLWK